MASQHTKPEHSKKRVQKAGVTALDPDAPILEYNEAIQVLNNWRASHAVPLHGISQNVRNTVRRISDSAVVARRLKRMRSVLHKLERYPSMSAARIQDYGGVRAIMGSVEDVNTVVDKLRTSRQKHELIRDTDYIQQPDSDGYRGIHLIFAFESAKYPDHRGLPIEAQIRTEIQHAWATAVETMGYVTRQPLKSDMGDPELLEFFRELSTEFARMEDSPPVPGTIPDREGRVARIRELEAKHSVESRLSVYSLVIADRDAFLAGAQYALLAIEDMTLRVTRFTSLEEAEAAYAEREKDPDVDVVLVSADDMESLEKAYPNYFADTNHFRALLDSVLTDS